MTDLFPETVPDTRLTRGVDELRREIAMRKRMYPQWVERGTLRKAVADRQLADLENLLELIREKL